MKLNKKLATQESADNCQMRNPLRKLVVLNEAKIEAVESAGRKGCGMCG